MDAYLRQGRPCNSPPFLDIAGLLVLTVPRVTSPISRTTAINEVTTPRAFPRTHDLCP